MRTIILIIFTLLCFGASAQISTDAQLTTQSDVIRNEVANKANSKTRIADMFQALINSKVNKAGSVVYAVSLSNLTTALTSGTNKAYFRLPAAMTVTAVRASLLTAQASGTTLTIDINENGVSILSTKLTIDNTEKTSTTAATSYVLSDTTLADDAEITFDIDAVDAATSAAGLIVEIIGY